MPINLEQIKRHGAIIGLESELSARLSQLKAAIDQKKWAYVVSHATYIREVAEELRKLNEKTLPTSIDDLDNKIDSAATS